MSWLARLRMQIPLPDVDPEGYKKALARTRQAQDVARAVTFMHNGEPARWVTSSHFMLSTASC